MQEGGYEELLTTLLADPKYEDDFVFDSYDHHSSTSPNILVSIETGRKIDTEARLISESSYHSFS
jgi:hypothetical protein